MNCRLLKWEEQMSRTEIKAWAELAGVSQTRIQREMREANDLTRARTNPDKWIVLRYPEDGSFRAYPRRMFEGATA
jgi:hypothetical protein